MSSPSLSSFTQTIRQHWHTGTAEQRPLFRAANSLLRPTLSLAGRKKYSCPICISKDPFIAYQSSGQSRTEAMCLGCGSLERHRLQWLVMESLNLEFREMSMLHFAPEPFFRPRFQRMFRRYVTADLDPRGVDYQADITKLPFPDSSFDFVYASHVLEHVKDDKAALSEIRRVLTPNGIAILPVPLLTQETVEYPRANPRETYHVRQPGYDYYDRYSYYFGRVEAKSSADFAQPGEPDPYRLYIQEDRSHWPTADLPWRVPMAGSKHLDVVPICYKQVAAVRLKKPEPELELAGIAVTGLRTA